MSISNRLIKQNIKPRKKRISAAILIATLFLSLILLIMGMALLSIRTSQMKTAVLTGQAVRARHIAESGMEDAKIKLQKCVDFPQQVEDQEEFTYREEVSDFDGNILGIYRITINLKNRGEHNYVQVISLGITGHIISNPTSEQKKECIIVGHNSDQYLRPEARRLITAIMPTDPPTVTSPHPNNYQYINYWDGGSY
ncbi:MAG: hypothetical protein K8T10_05620 [Candidatus Eremiobacteraeota bacterium]|nr:hypothetical protein [Candidatus Eremiobacteraeota bacterium]